MVRSGWLTNDSICLRLQRSIKYCVASWCMDWNLTHKDLIKNIVCNTDSNKCIMHWWEPFPGTPALKEFLDQELNEHEDDEKFNYCQWDTTDQGILTIFTAPYEEYKETLIDVIDDLTRHSYITNLQSTSFWYRAKSKATTGVKNTEVTSLGCILLGTRW